MRLHLHRWSAWSPVYQKAGSGRCFFVLYHYRNCRKCGKRQERLV